MISLDGSLVVQIVNFLFLIFVLNQILYRPIRKILSQREETISGLEERIAGSKREAKEKDRMYLAGIKEARSKGLAEKEKMIQAASEEEKRLIAKINEKAAADLLSVREKIAKDAEKVKVSLLEEINTFAQEIGQKILGRTV